MVELSSHLSHAVNERSLGGPFPAGSQVALFGMGCFWGAEKKFWDQPGVWVTAVGYAGGSSPDPTYSQVCSGKTGHGEVVLVVFNENQVTYRDLLKVFWESHDPTQGMRQGNDIGTQYRSMIGCTTPTQLDQANQTRDLFQVELSRNGYAKITTEILFPAPRFYYAEDYHQQYLAKNPSGYCGLGGTGVSCPIGLARAN